MSGTEQRVAEACPKCGLTNQKHLYEWQSAVAPRVLCLILKRFLGPGQSVLHPVVPDEVLYYGDKSYDLRSVVVHLGDTLDAGHYVAVSNHATPDGDWWLFNDHSRTKATHLQKTTEGSTDGTQMKSYVAFYEQLT